MRDVAMRTVDYGLRHRAMETVEAVIASEDVDRVAYACRILGHEMACGNRSARTRMATLGLSKIVEDMDGRNVEDRVLAALSRMGGAYPAEAVHAEVAGRIRLKEEARVQLLHCLGKDLVWSHHDVYSLDDIRSVLRTLRSAGRISSILPIRFWTGRRWFFRNSKISACKSY
jgi:hypothetical protein